MGERVKTLLFCHDQFVCTYTPYYVRKVIFFQPLLYTCIIFRYVGLAGGTAAKSGIVIGAEFSLIQYPGLPRNDGTYQGRRYFLTPPQSTALFVPFSKVVMAWAN